MKAPCRKEREGGGQQRKKPGQFCTVAAGTGWGVGSCTGVLSGSLEYTRVESKLPLPSKRFQREWREDEVNDRMQEGLLPMGIIHPSS
jgi:hypothetical protein